MAEFLQGQLKIIHTMEEATPTGAKDPTAPTDSNINEDASPKTADDVGKKGWKKQMGKAGVQRRLLNIATFSVDAVVNRQFDKAIFKESLYGSRRGMKKIQNNKAIYAGITSQTKALTGGVITSVALNNFTILAIQSVSEVLNISKRIESQMYDRSQFEERRALEVYVSNRRRERMIVGTYNRR